MLSYFLKKEIKEIPITSDSNARYVPWIIAMLTFLLTVILALSSSLSLSINNLNEKKQILVEFSEESDGAKVLNCLKTLPFIANIDSRFLANKKIECELSVTSNLNNQVLQQKLKAISSDVKIVLSNRFEDLLHQIGGAMQVCAYVITAFLTLIVMVTIGLLTRSGLLIHKEIIDVMQLIGATDSYIVRQFQNQAMNLSLKGSVLGLIPAVPAILFGFWLMKGFSQMIFDWPSIIFISILPFAISILSILVAKMTVLQKLQYDNNLCIAG